MFQLGSLVVLCGLLTGTSASLSEFIQKLDVPVNFSQKTEHQERTIENIVLLYDSMTLRRLNYSFYLNNMRHIFSGQRKRDLQAGLSSNDNSTEMKMLLIVDSSVYLPDDNPRKRAMISLKLLCFLRNVTESQNSLLYVTLWIWANETMKDISDSSGRENAMMESIMDRLFNSLSERDSLLMEKQVLEMSDAPLKLLAQAILNDLKMEENQSPSSEE